MLSLTSGQKAGKDVTIDADVVSRVLVLSGPAADVQKLEDFVRAVDKPDPNIELTVYTVLGSNQPASAIPPAPPALQPVLKEIGSLYPYASYDVKGVMVLRGKLAMPASGKDVIALDDTARLPQTFQAVPVGVAQGASGRVILLADITYSAEVRMPVVQQGEAQVGPRTVRSPNAEVSFSAALDVREGECVLAGKASAGQPGSSLFVIVSARVLDMP